MKIERSTTTRERKGTFVMRFSSLVLCLAAASVALGQAAPATSPAVPLPSLPLPPLIAPPATAPSDAKPDALLTIFRAGQYQDTIDAATKILAESPDAPVEVWQLKIRAQLLTGKYDDALQAYRKAVDAHDESLSIRMLGWQTLLDNNKTAEAKKLLKEILDLADADSWRYADAANRVALGEAMLRSGTDARRVLENYYDRAKRSDPNLLAPLMATGELALEKHDFAMATEAYRAAQKIAPDDPDVYVGLAKASEDDDPEAAATAVAKALELNPNHMDALLMVADRQIYSEQYTNAGTTLGKAISVNPKEPRAWAYLAVLANLTGKHDSEVAARAEALDIWKTNPAVDELIGEKLAQEYRFAEGAEYQKKSLAFDADYLPAKFELSQDLLRLGKEEDGWKLVDEVFKKDPYNVTAFNLMTLHDVMEKMTVLTTDHFIVHMDPKEAQIYGQRVLDLLEKARANFTAKYDVQLPEKTNIEIFTTQADFAVRTFGLPGEEGFLGVCFGPVVTVNSPAAQGAHLTNWESILWHEFCHTITLTKTKNKMPRWLSEGISVYEERQGNPGWGEQFIPPYRETVLKGDMTPVSQLSQAFLHPPDPIHLSFAYFEASMVVEYINKKFGIEALKAILTDLGDGVQINDALAAHTVPIDKLDADFAAFMKDGANQLAPKANWDEPDVAAFESDEKLAKWNEDHPNSFNGLTELGRHMLDARKWNDAKTALQKAIDVYPNYPGEDGPYVFMSVAQRELGDLKGEQETLETFSKLNADALQPRLRLMEIYGGAKNWAALRAAAEQTIAVNPLIAAPHRFLAQAAEETGDRKLAIQERKILLLMDPLDLAEQHYRLAKLLFDEKQWPQARQEIDKSLEEAPRYRAAYSLLLEIKAKMDGETPSVSVPADPSATAPAAGR